MEVRNFPFFRPSHGRGHKFEPCTAHQFSGSTPLRGDGHSPNTVNYAVPTAMSQDSDAVIFKISAQRLYPIRGALLHLGGMGIRQHFAKMSEFVDMQRAI